MQTDLVLGVVVTFLRTVADLFFLFHVVLKFRTAFNSPTSHVYGRKELISDPTEIARRYLKHDFVIDLLATLPLPQIFPLQRRILKTSGLIAKTALAGALYNLGFYMLASHVLGATCSYGQNIQTSTYSGETLFCSFICIAGLILFAHLIGNMQNYLQSSTARLEEWRLRQKDTEEWMNHRQLPPELQERVRRFVQYKWLATRGVDEEAILKSLPVDLRRQIQRHLCLDIVRRVPFFGQMDDQLLDAICERLVSSLNTKDSYIVREGDPVREMLFIIRGSIESSTTDGGRTGFYNSITLKPGDFCGEELLTWALMPASSLSLPSSTRTVKSITEVEAFALRAEDLKFVSSQFKRLHSKKLQHAFRYYSHQWRAWGASFIQAAWRRHRKRQLAMELLEKENLLYDESGGGESSMGMEEDSASHGQNFGATFLASKFAANTRKGAVKKVAIIPDSSSLKMPKMFKPTEPDFSTFHED
ncbi:cyclic nucleotide-gated ion channel-like protein [Trifolium pratense]|uniref:Cyclic nucleotide-gated ion channel-like protein n=1 Tax=Trifolium pratense TaxID=57577 RepID=A0A2K3N5H4_TRIPR|nr:cyclic nucleotide-gated ion channel-like protein [Trifolium pratense]